MVGQGSALGGQQIAQDGIGENSVPLIEAQVFFGVGDAGRDGAEDIVELPGDGIVVQCFGTLIAAQVFCRGAAAEGFGDPWAEIAEGALEAMLAEVRVGMSERELGSILDSQMIRLGGQGTAFETLLHGGGNTALPHTGLLADGGYPEWQTCLALESFDTSWRIYAIETV